MKIVFVTHDCCLAGAQRSLLRILRWFIENTRWDIRLLALGGGVLAQEFAELAPFMECRDVRGGAKAQQASFEQIRTFIGESPPDLIFGNTVVSAGAYDYLSRFRCPIVTRVAELDSSIDRYATVEIMRLLVRHSTAYIAVSRQVASMLSSRFQIAEERITVVNGAVSDVATSPDLPRRDDLLARVGCAGQAHILWGCGSISRRKGADLFLKVGEALLAAGVEDYHALWAGHPEDDLVRTLFLEKESSPARNHVTFLGTISNPAHVMVPGDLFLMTSREDPFPLVCLEAAERGVGSLCFPGTGGIVDFVESGGGEVATDLSPQAMAEVIIPLLKSKKLREDLGKRARRLLIERHTLSTAGPQLKQVLESVVKRWSGTNAFVRKGAASPGMGGKRSRNITI